MSSADEIESALKELLPFLDVLSPAEYKGQILDYILGMTGTSDGVKCLGKNQKLITNLIDLIQFDKSDKIKLDCTNVLVNLSSTCHDVLQHLLTSEFIYFLLNVVVQKDLEYSDPSAMLLANLSQDSSNCDVIAKELREHDKVSLSNVVDAFCTPGYNKHCKLHHLGSFISNMTSLREERLQLLESDAALLKKILPFTQFEESSVRRFSAAVIIKNCLFETGYHESLLIDNKDILVHLILPLAGSEEYDEDENEEMPLDLQYLPPDKVRESNKDIQKLLIESLFQLCATKTCRLIMKKSGVYYFMRELHKITDEDDPIMMGLENLVQVLIGDEPMEKEHSNFRDIDIPEDIQKKLDMQIVPS